MRIIQENAIRTDSADGSDSVPVRSKKTTGGHLCKGLVVLIDEGLCSVTNFLAGVLVARACTKSQYGLYVLGFSVLIMIQLIMRSCVSVPYTVNSPSMRRQQRASYFSSSLFQAVLMASLFAGGIAAIGLIVNSVQSNSEMFSLLCVLSVLVLCVTLRDFMRHALLAHLRLWASLAMGLIANAATLSLMVWMYADRSLSVTGAYLVMAACSLMVAGAMVLRHWRKLRLDRSCILGDMWKNWRTGRWTLAAVLAGNISLRIMPWLVLLWCGKADVAVFGALMAIAAIVGPIARGLGTYMAPRLANDYACHGRQGAIHSAKLVLKGTAIVSFVYIAVLAIWGENITALIFTADYVGHTSLLTLLAITVAIEAMLAPLRALLRVLRYPHVEFRGTLWGAAAGLSLSVWLIPSHGIIGAGIALLICRLTVFGVALMAVLEVNDAEELARQRTTVEV